MPDIPFYLLIPIAWQYVISSRINTPRSYPFAPTRLQLHEGIDFAPKPTQDTLYVRAAQRGIVAQIGFDARGYGNFVRVVHQWGPERYVTWYGHLAKVLTKENAYVNAGDTLGIAGSTGNSTGTHLHLTLQHIGKGLRNYVVADVIDPEPFLTGKVIPFDEAWWVVDVSISDGTKVSAGQPFRKTWRIRNAGTTTWGAGYQVAFFSDLPMNGKNIALPPAKPGDQADISLDLVAPNSAGTQRSTWKPQNADKTFFDYALYAEINVQAVASEGANEAHFVDDVTIPFDMQIKPGQPFRKTWRIRNTGSTAWGDGYQFAFIAGDPMGAPHTVPLPPTQPGDETDVSVDLVAPMQAGKVLSTWQPRDPQGNLFDFPVRVEIVVIPSGQIDNSGFATDVIVLQPGQSFLKTWRIPNTGQTRWGDGYVLVFLEGDPMGAPATIPVPATKPQAQADIGITLTAPAKTGVYTGHWELRNPEGQGFGPVYQAQIEVRA